MVGLQSARQELCQKEMEVVFDRQFHGFLVEMVDRRGHVAIGSRLGAIESR